MQIQAGVGRNIHVIIHAIEGQLAVSVFRVDRQERYQLVTEVDAASSLQIPLPIRAEGLARAIGKDSRASCLIGRKIIDDGVRDRRSVTENAHLRATDAKRKRRGRSIRMLKDWCVVRLGSQTRIGFYAEHHIVTLPEETAGKSVPGIGIRSSGESRSYKYRQERAQQGLAATARVVYELKESQIQR
jgi:hypothetical protein